MRPTSKVAPIKEGLLLRDTWRRLYKPLLDTIFEECASGKIALGPDEAMRWMEELLEPKISTSHEVAYSNDGSAMEAGWLIPLEHIYPEQRVFKRSQYCRVQDSNPLLLCERDSLCGVRRIKATLHQNGRFA